MDSNQDSLFGLAPADQKKLLSQFPMAEFGASTTEHERRRDMEAIPARFGQFKELPEYKQMQVHAVVSQKLDIANPFFICHEQAAKASTRIGGKKFRNFSTYDYIGLNGHPEVNAAAREAMERYGTSAGASRLVGGERPPHAALEKALAEVYETAGAVAFVSGHATNVSTLSTLLGPRDAVYHDALAHNSLILGAAFSGAARYAYPHNDCAALESLLHQTRAKHERVIIATEGLFGMDGSTAKLPELIALKRQHTCWLMVDEAHALGVLGGTGRGSAEHYGVPFADVDIWMGTLSKTLCGCGGFIAGCEELVMLLKFRAPGFVYSVGMPPPMAAASAKALEIMLREPQRTARMQELSNFFLREAKLRCLDTGWAEGYGIIPIIVGNSLVTGVLASRLFKRRFNVLPIIYPAVEEGMARLRFFLSSEHREKDIAAALDAVVEELPKAQETAHSR